MENYLFSLEAISLMLVECYRRGNSKETGGILIGPENHTRIVTDAIASSEHAERAMATYYQSDKDIEILNNQLRKYQSQGKDFKGYFHWHNRLSTLSEGDLGTCSDILRSPSYCINNTLLMCIITNIPEQNFPVFSYVVSLENGKVIVREVGIKVLPKRCIEECMDCFEERKVSNEDNGIGKRLGGNESGEEGYSLRIEDGQGNNSQLNTEEARPFKCGCTSRTR